MSNRRDVSTDELHARFYNMLVASAQLVDAYEEYINTKSSMSIESVEEFLEEYHKVFLAFSEPLFEQNFQTYFIEGKIRQ